ncbi:MAG TPA: GNAT family N-acetyltransferase [Pyrinomonadaceae bacterium]|nr:GNAT family N-acetyltransferase [Pyrinomonadaceae bacterium]
MSIAIRNINENDLSAVADLMRSFAEYENLSEYCTVTMERLYRAMFSDEGFVEGLIAFDDETPIAYALFYPNFSSFRGEMGLYLEDIYVLADYRRHQLGLQLLRKIASIAKERGLERIDFQVLDWNTPAVNFYLKHGAEQNDGESHFKFAGDAFARLAS